ncbi:response regulator transcription factor [Brevundimonas sp.]|uniref:response regulator transcription factor n=1 Tax=Brevundimonas sp. TaxID=1871086 RepID=UPI002ABB60DA|nr:response regulator [Brevundimonas sp.]MDZ4363235.1 response regulator [Brevundimonas sp.]
MTTLLIVEDDALIREMMDITLSQAGYGIVTAGSGSSALDVLRRLRVDLVLLDVHMPKMSGLDVLAAMRRMGAVMPPVLMVTANRSAETVQEAMRLGCVGYVAKPFSPNDLLSRVQRVLKPVVPVPSARRASAAEASVLEI